VLAFPPQPATADDGSTPPVSGADLAWVENAQIILLESFPVQVHAVVAGQLPDGCTAIAQITQTREGNRFTIVITVAHTGADSCTQALVPFEEVVPLNVVGLTKGVYQVMVNDVSAAFELTSDNVMPSASISGTVWHDLCAASAHGQPGPETAPPGCVAGDQGGYQADGVLQAGEPGIGEVLISLRDGRCRAGDEIATARTAADGRYRFGDLAPGDYCVLIDVLAAENAHLLPGGWTYPQRDPEAGAAYVALSLAPGEEALAANFGWDYL